MKNTSRDFFLLQLLEVHYAAVILFKNLKGSLIQTLSLDTRVFTLNLYWFVRNPLDDLVSVQSYNPLFTEFDINEISCTNC